MKKSLFTIISIICAGSLFSQNTKTITFTARYTDDSYVSLSSVRVENLTKKWVQTLEWPDTILVFNWVGIQENQSAAFSLAQNTPNPFSGHTSVNLQLPQDEEVSMALYDLSGKQYLHKTASLSAGNYTIQLSVATPQMYLLQVQTTQGSQSIKMLAETGTGNFSLQIQAVEKHISLLRKADSQYGFEPGDTIAYTGRIQGVEQCVGWKEVFTANDTTITFVFSKISGYTLLDIYYDSLDRPEGIVWHLSDTIGYDNGKPYGKHGKIMSFDRGGGMMYSSYFDMKFAHAFDSLDGEANTDSLMKLRYDTTLSFPERLQAAPWCRAHGDKWYMPAILEVLEFRILRDSLNAKFEGYSGWKRIACNQPGLLEGAVWLWSSTEIDNAATEPSKRKAYASCFARGVDIGQWSEFEGRYHDYYSSINVLHTFEEKSVIAVKKF
ncbi:MAG: T9SS type A sorting domain-containing protein [Bacteroidales bacterium]|nr:T9SS type A sorting domain-containing protein [Bacteroidales bacterium]